jgi:pyruvate/2-oxoglutarate dehydrogenase complex dihydrolipoamide dehydrogenase (E3) component
MHSTRNYKSKNMTNKREIKADICIIGAGSAGLSTAYAAANLGLKTVLFEGAAMGGDCLNHGCVPSKALLAAAKAANDMRGTEKYGVTIDAEPKVDWQKVRAHVQGVIDHIAPVDSVERFESFGTIVISEYGRFVDDKTVESETTRVKAKRFVIATGSTAFIPPIPGLAETPYLTNHTIFTTPDFPEKLTVLGGGPIGIEMAQAFQRLGSQVTVIEMGRALARADEGHAATALEALRKEGITILEGHKAVEVSGTAGNVTVRTETADGGGQSVDGTHILVAVGRRTFLDGLDIEKANVKTERGSVVVKKNLQSVSNKRVWALGDATGKAQFTHVAGYHASIFTQAAILGLPGKDADAAPLPAVTYMQPEIAQLGMTEAEARAKHGDKVVVGSFAFDENDRAIAERKTDGEVKIIWMGKKILGASILGESAGDLLQIVSIAMVNNLGPSGLINHMSPYPTRAEAVKRAVSGSDQFGGRFFSSKAIRFIVGLRH